MFNEVIDAGVTVGPIGYDTLYELTTGVDTGKVTFAVGVNKLETVVLVNIVGALGPRLE